VSTVSRLHQRGPFVARQIAFNQVSSNRVQFGAAFPQRQRSTGFAPVALRAFYSRCAA
jgi:hypothetical protein